MNDLEFYKNIYEKELERKRDIYNYVNLPFGLSTIIVGLIYFFVQNEIELLGCSKVIYFGSIFISIVLLLIGGFLLIRTIWFKEDYKEFPKINVLREYQIKMNDAKGFEKYIVKKYVEYADSYVNLNDKRSKFLFNSYRYTILSLCALILPLIVFLIKTITL